MSSTAGITKSLALISSPPINTNAKPSNLDLDAKIKNHLDPKVVSAKATSIPFCIFQESDDADGSAGFEGTGSPKQLGMLDVTQVPSRCCLGFSDVRVDNRMPKRMPGAGVDWKIAQDFDGGRCDFFLGRFEILHSTSLLVNKIWGSKSCVERFVMERA